jgi:hypothetical protein
MVKYSTTSRVGKGYEMMVVSSLLQNLDKQYDVYLPAVDDNGCDVVIINSENNKIAKIQIKAKHDGETLRFGNIKRQAPDNTLFLFYSQEQWSLIPRTEFNFSQESTSKGISVSVERFNKFALTNIHDISGKIKEILR